ncbi:8794_t:CDS:2 [Funneliformis caledonium]|uniref:8794_t:CDS:1 n=1 Tax=Funneliformis caledonium TaxID=1117310 RepID=A0A9N9BJK9_9GLOM|nr:8794_t:CDS:2 [Funneliformis caledonium]
MWDNLRFSLLHCRIPPIGSKKVRRRTFKLEIPLYTPKIMKAQEIYRMEEINVDDRKEILSVEQQTLQPTSPKEEEPAHSSNDDREFERDHNYQRTREENTTQLQEEKQNEIADQNEQSLSYESDPIERNIQDSFERNSRYSEKHKNGSKNYNRKRIRSNSDRSDSYYSQPSEEPRTPIYEPEIHPPSSWHSNNRMPRKDYFTDDRKKNRMRYRNRDFNHERMHLFDRIQIKDNRNRGPERERDYEIMDRKERYERERGLRVEREHEIRERDVVRPRDNPTRYYEEPHPRFRVPYYEYGREADRIRAPYFDYHREPDFREREYPRYRDFDWDPYYHRASPPPPGHFHYRDNLKRPNDYFYQQSIYPRRSLSPRARYSHNRRSLSPNSRRVSNPTYERRYERDRPPRYDSIRENEFDARRNSIHYNAPHYNELHSPGFDHYNPPAIPPSPINLKSSYEDNGFTGVVSTVNESSYERERPPKARNWDINADKGNKEGKRGQNNSNDNAGGGYERERGRGRERRKLWDEIIHDKPKDVDADNHSNSTIVSTTPNANNNSSTDRTRDRIRNEKSRNMNSNDDKYHDISTDRNSNSGDATKEPYERHATREKNNKYWEKNEEKSRDFDRNITKNRERDNKERAS